MEAKKEIIKKIVMSRRLLATSRLMEETKLNTDVLLHIQKKRLLLLKQIHLLNTVQISLASERLTWKVDRNQSFWEIECKQADETCFRNKFRMSRSRFYKLCELLPGLRKSDSQMREAIPLEKRVAIALYALGSSARYRKISDLFGVGRASVCKILLSFCNEVWRVLAPIYLKNFPMRREKLESLVQEFEELGFPQCMGALDGCHIEIYPSQGDALNYYNNKEWYSIVLLALVDARCRFIHVDCGNPGRISNSQVFERSSLKKQLDMCTLLTNLKKRISGVNIPVFIIGDATFPLSDKLMTPYPTRKSQNHIEKNFNYALSTTRKVVEDAFTQLKARFTRISHGFDNTLKNTNTIILSCCVLHNFLKENDDVIGEKWLHDLEAIESSRLYPEGNVPLTDHCDNAETIRNAISSYLRVDDGAFFSGGTGVAESSDISMDGSVS